MDRGRGYQFNEPLIIVVRINALVAGFQHCFVRQNCLHQTRQRGKMKWLLLLLFGWIFSWLPRIPNPMPKDRGSPKGAPSSQQVARLDSLAVAVWRSLWKLLQLWEKYSFTGPRVVSHLIHWLCYKEHLNLITNSSWHHPATSSPRFLGLKKSCKPKFIALWYRCPKGGTLIAPTS